MRRFFAALSLLCFLSGVPAFAIDTPLQMDKAFNLSVDRTEGTTTFRWRIAEGYYLYREAMQAKAEDGSVLELETQPGKLKDDPGFGQTEVYFKDASAILKSGPEKLTLTFQGCQDGGICYPVRTVSITGSQIEAASPFGLKPPVATAFQSFARIDEAQTPASPAPVAAAAQPSGMIEGYLIEGGAAMLLVSFIGLGVLLAFTPCVFPMYPILAATLGGQGRSLSPARGFLLSSTYVVFLALAFSLFGVAAAWLGQSFQIALQSATAVAIMAAVFAALAIASFGMVEIQLPSFVRNRLANSQRSLGGSLGSAALLGFSSALLIGPCVTAPLAGVLLYIAKTGDMRLGAAALFALGIGKGIPLIIIGTSGAALLPRAGAWMMQVRWLFGFMFMGTAIWYLDRLVDPAVTLALAAALLVTMGVFFGAFDALVPADGTGKRVAKSAGLLCVLYGALLAFGAASGATSVFQPLKQVGGGSIMAANIQPLDKDSFAKVKDNGELDAAVGSSASGRPSLVYFTADWCVSCRVVERSVLSDADVIAGLGDFNLVSVDLSEMTVEKQDLMNKRNVVGPPTMLFFDKHGRELPSATIVGDVSSRSVLASTRLAEATR